MININMRCIEIIRYSDGYESWCPININMRCIEIVLLCKEHLSGYRLTLT